MAEELLLDDGPVEPGSGGIIIDDGPTPGTDDEEGEEFTIEDEPAAKPKEKQKEREKAEPEPERLTAAERRELAELRAKAKTSEEVADFYRKQYEAATKAEKPKAEPKAKAPEAEYDPERWVEEFVKDPRRALSKVGAAVDPESLASQIEERLAAKLDERLSEQRRVNEAESKLIRDYPDMANSDSDLFKTTLEILRGSGDENAAQDIGKVRLAAEAAKYKLAASKVGRMAREERVAAQGPAGGRLTGEGRAELTATQRAIVAKMGLTEKEYVGERKRTGRFQ